MKSPWRLKRAWRFSAAEVQRCALVTARQLQLWSERGLLCPDPAGYSPNHLFVALLYQELRERGLARAFWRVAREVCNRGVGPFEGKRWLLTDGTRVMFLDHSDVVMAFLEQRRSPLFAVIPLVPLVDRIEHAGALIEAEIARIDAQMLEKAS